MQKLEIKEIGLKSVFKVTAYVMVIPAALFLLVAIIMAIIGAATGENEVLIIGIAYIFFSVLMIPLYGAINILMSLIYNAFSKKFGGLELTVKQIDEQ